MGLGSVLGPTVNFPMSVFSKQLLYWVLHSDGKQVGKATFRHFQLAFQNLMKHCFIMESRRDKAQLVLVITFCHAPICWSLVDFKVHVSYVQHFGVL